MNYRVDAYGRPSYPGDRQYRAAENVDYTPRASRHFAEIAREQSFDADDANQISEWLCVRDLIRAWEEEFLYADSHG